jgi:hypothetical protein
VIDMSAFQIWLAVLIGWLDRQEREARAYLIEDNRVLRAQLGERHLSLTDDDRRRLDVRAFRLSRQALRQVSTIVTPDTRYGGTGNSLPVNGPTRAGPAWLARRNPALVVQMAEGNPAWD